MKVLDRHSDGTPSHIEFEGQERAASDYFDGMLDRGYNMHEALKFSLLRYSDCRELLEWKAR